MKAAELMTRKVHTVAPATPVRDIARTMLSRRISAVPVVDRQKRVLGIVSEGDLVRRAEAGTERRASWWLDLLADPADRARDYMKSRGSRAQDVMTRPVISVAERTEAGEIADVLERWNIKRVPVVRAGKLVGIVSRRDLLRAVGQGTRSAKRAKATDPAIRERLREQLDSMAWLDTALVNFVVDKGAIELFGFVGSAEERNALRLAAENIPGVRKVADRLSIRPLAYYAT